MNNTGRTQPEPRPTPTDAVGRPRRGKAAAWAALLMVGVFLASTFASPVSVAQSSTESLTVTTTSLPEAQVTQSYTAQLEATGGVAPLVWSISEGALPGGLHLDPTTGGIGGVPLQAGTAELTVQVTDAALATAIRPLVIVIAPAPGDLVPEDVDTPFIQCSEVDNADMPSGSIYTCTVSCPPDVAGGSCIVYCDGEEPATLASACVEVTACQTGNDCETVCTSSISMQGQNQNGPGGAPMPGDGTCLAFCDPSAGAGGYGCAIACQGVWDADAQVCVAVESQVPSNLPPLPVSILRFEYGFRGPMLVRPLDLDRLAIHNLTEITVDARMTGVASQGENVTLVARAMNVTAANDTLGEAYDGVANETVLDKGGQILYNQTRLVGVMHVDRVVFPEVPVNATADYRLVVNRNEYPFDPFAGVDRLPILPESPLPPINLTELMNGTVPAPESIWDVVPDPENEPGLPPKGPTSPFAPSWNSTLPSEPPVYPLQANQPPYLPKVDNPYQDSGRAAEVYKFRIFGADRDEGMIKQRICIVEYGSESWEHEECDEELYTAWHVSETWTTRDHVWAREGMFCYQVHTIDDGGAWSRGTSWHCVSVAAPNREPPRTPNNPSGPAEGDPNTVYQFSTMATDPDGDDLAYWFCFMPDGGDECEYHHTSTDEGEWIESGEWGSVQWSFDRPGKYLVAALAWDGKYSSSYSDYRTIDIGGQQSSNQPPGPAVVAPKGPIHIDNGGFGARVDYWTNATDPENDALQYWFCIQKLDTSECDWKKTLWHDSGSTGYIYPTIAAGEYRIRTVAFDGNSFGPAATGPVGKAGEIRVLWSHLTVEGPNEPPDRPATPSGPAWGVTGRYYTFSTSSSDPNRDKMYFKFSTHNGERWETRDAPSNQTPTYGNGAIASTSFSWNEPGTYGVRAYAIDEHGLGSSSSGVHYIEISQANRPPNVPAKPRGPQEVEVGEEVTYLTRATDPDGDDVRYLFMFGTSGSTSWNAVDAPPRPINQPQNYVPSGSIESATFKWYEPGHFVVYARSFDEHEAGTRTWSDPLHVHVIDPGNRPPLRPEPPTGPEGGYNEDTWYDYMGVTTDPDRDDIYYEFIFGSSTNNVTTGTVTSGTPGTASYRWEEPGTYYVWVRAIDEHGASGQWSWPLEVHINSRDGCTGPTRTLPGGLVRRGNAEPDDPDNPNAYSLDDINLTWAGKSWQWKYYREDCPSEWYLTRVSLLAGFTGPSTFGRTTVTLKFGGELIGDTHCPNQQNCHPGHSTAVYNPWYFVEKPTDPGAGDPDMPPESLIMYRFTEAACEADTQGYVSPEVETLLKWATTAAAGYFTGATGAAFFSGAVTLTDLPNNRCDVVENPRTITSFNAFGGEVEGLGVMGRDDFYSVDNDDRNDLEFPAGQLAMGFQSSDGGAKFKLVTHAGGSAWAIMRMDRLGGLNDEDDRVERKSQLNIEVHVPVRVARGTQ